MPSAAVAAAGAGVSVTSSSRHGAECESSGPSSALIALKIFYTKETLLISGVLNSLHISEKKRAFHTQSTVKISSSGDKQSLTIYVFHWGEAGAAAQ